MTPSPDPPPPEKPPLEYASRRSDPFGPAGGVPRWVQVLIGIVVAVLCTVGSGVIAAVLNAHLVGTFIAAWCTFLAILAVATLAHIRWQWPGVVLGAVIGLAISIIFACAGCCAFLGSYGWLGGF